LETIGIDWKIFLGLAINSYGWSSLIFNIIFIEIVYRLFYNCKFNFRYKNV